MFDLKQLHNFFSLLRAEFANHMDELNALDASVGDGDHGFTVAGAFAAAEAATRPEFTDLGQGFDAAAQSLAESSGGAIGPLLAAFFAEGGVTLTGKTKATTADIYQFFNGGLEAVKAVGGAKPGEKTMIDALEPAVSAMASRTSLPLVEAVSAAVDAARQGAEATREMVAVHGRAHFLGERSAGYQDAGATSIALLFETLSLALQGRTAPPLPDATITADPVPPPGKLINHPHQMVSEDNEGLSLAFPKLVALTADHILVRAEPKAAGKVGLAIGHGGGHTPSMGGFVGPGLLDADVYGPIFTCASGVRIARAIDCANRAAGVVLLVSNHAGDVLNARLAVRRTEQSGIAVQPVILGDDIATAPREKFKERRGLGGLLFALKIGGAAAEAGESLAETTRLMEKTNERTATLAVAVRPPTHPATGQPLFALPDKQIEIGTGVHGEIGLYRGPLLPADQITDMLIERLTQDLAPLLKKRVLVFVNGSGGTSKMELHILYRRVYRQLTGAGLDIAAGVVEALFTTQEMGGFSLSLCAIDDDLQPWWELPATGPYFRWP